MAETSPLLKSADDVDGSNQVKSTFPDSSTLSELLVPQISINVSTEDVSFINTTLDGSKMIVCRVCSENIDLSNKMSSKFIKCPKCNEATPLKSAPQGKKYVRCPCNSLLVCKEHTSKVMCPRSSCKRVLCIKQNLNLGNSNTRSTFNIPPGSCRIFCGNCSHPFIIANPKVSIVKCSFCNKKTILASSKKKYLFLYLLATLLLLIPAILLLVTSLHKKDKVGFKVGYILFFLLSSFTFAKFYIYATRPSSQLEDISSFPRI